jgi:hypothetical protein
MRTKTLEAVVASPPEKDDLVVQIFVKDGGQWGEIIYDKKGFKLELYAQSSGDPWILDLDEVEEVFALAREELRKRLG